MLFVMLMALSVALFSCKGGMDDERHEAVKFLPLETVRRLVKENRQFTEGRPAGGMPSSAEFKAIQDRGHIVFAMVAHDQKPFFYKDEETEELTGLDVEIGYAIANRLEVAAVFNRDAVTFDGVIMKVAEGEADIALSKLSVTSRRAELVRFTKPYFTFRQALLVNRLEFAKIGPEQQLPRFIKNFRGTIGVLNNTSYVNFAPINFPAAEVKPFAIWNEAIDALFAGELLAIYRDEGEILIVNATRKDASILTKPIIIGDKRDPLAMAVSVDAPMLQNWLNVFLDEYLLENHSKLTPSRLIERHFSFGN
jgi:ABC-type amino acid transport substrate-binding protein